MQAVYQREQRPSVLPLLGDQFSTLSTSRFEKMAPAVMRIWSIHGAITPRLCPQWMRWSVTCWPHLGRARFGRTTPSLFSNPITAIRPKFAPAAAGETRDRIEAQNSACSKVVSGSPRLSAGLNTYRPAPPTIRWRRDVIVFPTILELCGLKQPDHKIDGKSIVSHDSETGRLNATSDF